MSTLTEALQNLKPGTEVKLTMSDGSEVAGTVSESDASRVSLQDTGAVDADKVEDLVVLRSSDGPE